MVLHRFLLYLSHGWWNNMFPSLFMMFQKRFHCRFSRILSKFWNFRHKKIFNSLYKMWTFWKNFKKSYLSEYLKCIRPAVPVFWSVFSECPKLHDFFITSIKNACYNIAQTIQNTHSPWKRSTPVRNASFSDHFHWFSVPESIKFTVNFDDFNFKLDLRPKFRKSTSAKSQKSSSPNKIEQL